MALESYRKKRDFSRTPEPAPVEAPAGGRLYIIQKHAASRLHYDFRIELDGVLLSWAIPKGPSLDPHDKHLAVRVEDHPVEYGGFEGVIPKGEYGGGTVELWDRGTWEPEIDPHEGMKKGDLKFTLHGEKLTGSWVLARMKRRSEEEGKENWLLIKHRDDSAVDGDGSAILSDRPESVATGRTIQQIAEEADSVWHSTLPASQQTEVHPPGEGHELPDLTALPGAKKSAKLPRFVEPELCTLVKDAPAGDVWLHEIKFDGYRAVARIQRGKVVLSSRRDKDWTSQFGSVADELAKLPVSSAMLDGEVVVEGPDGRTSFGALQNELGSGRKDRLVYYVFDVPYLEGADLTGVPLEQRKDVLRALLAGQPAEGRIRYSEHVRGDGEAFHANACKLGVEGMVSKRAESVYRPGFRGADWLKVKCLQHQEFVIGGWSDPGGGRTDFGALLIGVRENGGLRYVGKVGTGFSDKLLHTLGRRLRGLALAPDELPFTLDVDRLPRDAHYVKPELVAEVSFIEWTGVGGLRHPSFLGLREDKPASEVVAELPKDTEQVAAGDGKAKEKRPARTKAPETAASGVSQASSRPRAAKGPEILGVTLTHPDRVFWPADHTTKTDLAEYYELVADRMLPFVLHRPVSMVRCPEGVAGVQADFHEHQGPAPCFFHKHAGPDFKGPFERLQIVESGGPGTYLAITEAASLVALAQMGVLEVHVWGSRSPDIEHPDTVVFDLDPAEDVGWAQLADAARLLRDSLHGLGLTSFVKTTGGKGLHVVVPIEPAEDWDGVKAFAKAMADGIAAYDPDKYVATMSKAKRVGRVFVDYLRNTRTATFIAPYSTRAKAHPTVSVPLRWEELSGKVRPDTYTIRNLPRRLAQLKRDPWEGYAQVRQRITPAMKRDLGLG